MARLRSRFRDATCRQLAPLMAAGALGLSACAAQATTDYQGDPLFSMAGRVEVQLTAATEKPLVPALAFTAPDSDEIRFIQPEVSGEFPAGFRVELFTPPPASVIDGFGFQDLPGEPRHTVGYITAVTQDHLPLLYGASAVTTVGEDCTASGCAVTWEARNFDASRRGTVTTACPPTGEPDNLFLACNVTARSGDPMLVAYFSDPMFAGAAENYAVAYLETAAAPNSFVARRFGSPGGLAAGYHLMRVLPADAQGEPARQACRDTAKADAIQSYSAANGVPASELSILVMGCNDPGCTMVGEHTRAVRGAWYRLMAERGCMFGLDYEPATSPDEQVTLRVEPGLNFVRAFAAL